MIKLDDRLLWRLDLPGLPRAHRDVLLRAMHQELEIRVGAAIAQHMTRRQLDDFGAFVRNRDEARAFAWLEHNYPGYREIVASQLEKLGIELRSSRAEVSALSVLYQD